MFLSLSSTEMARQLVMSRTINTNCLFHTGLELLVTDWVTSLELSSSSTQ